MEDAHAARLSLDKGAGNSNAFFSVYDGHGRSGTLQWFSIFHLIFLSCVLRSLSSQKNCNRRGVSRETFLGTDKDLVAGKFRGYLLDLIHLSCQLRHDLAHKYDELGCTAVAALFTGDGKMCVVGIFFQHQHLTSSPCQANVDDSRSSKAK
jgi:protein phosphatase 2C family protein 2/3